MLFEVSSCVKIRMFFLVLSKLMHAAVFINISSGYFFVKKTGSVKTPADFRCQNGFSLSKILNCLIE